MGQTKGYSIAYKGLKDGLHDFDFKVEGDLFETFECADIRDGMCDVKVALKRSESMLEVDVAIHGSVVVVCDRCTEEFDLPICFSGGLVVKFSDQVNEYDGEVMWVSPSESELDLAQYIYESIILSLPYQRVHPEGECDPEMLRRFNIVSDVEFAAIEARAGAAPVVEPSGEWAKLEALREQMTREQGNKTSKK